MVDLIVCAGFLSGLWPMCRLWSGSRGTTLRPTVGWTLIAWLSWLLMLLLSTQLTESENPLWPYLALCFSGCAGIAVFGARRPGERAWNFVVIGLLAVFLLPVAEGWGEPRLASAYLGFLAVILGISLLNYLPTRVGLGALCIGIAHAYLFYRLWSSDTFKFFPSNIIVRASLILTLGIWASYLLFVTRGKIEHQVNRRWLTFRDRFGVVWGQRTREQFNTAARNQNLDVVLSWDGIETTDEKTTDEAGQLLQSLLKRFQTET